ncbi:MAG: hypothetical protein PWP15_1288 [Methanothermococcus sp.]|jgi:MFS family permease|uniref:MFS transporter n=1 Tax=Methanothermococcus TaxID=155862 RepID=UPI00037DA2CB|nr:MULTISPECIES: MFS transporter [Methanothermococcus]MDK2790779.1 hypothetical protein [Methanothermococcus sp.]
MGKPIDDIFVVWVTTFVTMLGVGLIAPLMAIYAQSLGATNLEVGIIFGSFALARTMAQLPVGSLSDVYGKKIFMVIGTLFYGISTLFYNFVSTIAGLLVVRVFTGVFSSFITPVAGSYVATIAPKARMGEYMGVFNSAITLGLGVGPLVGGTLADIYGIEAPFYVCGILGILASIIAYTRLKDINVYGGSEENSIGEVMKINRLFSLEFLKNRNFLASFIINVSNMMINASVMAYLALYAIQYGVTPTYVGFMIATMNFLMAFLQKRFGILYDKIGSRVIIFGIAIMVSGIYLLSMSDSFIKMLFSLITAAIGASISAPAVMSLAINEIPLNRKGEAMGLFTTSINVGIFVGAISSGIIADYLGITNMYKVAALFSLIVSTVGYLLIEK